ncbi:molybdopterin-dependent oxidoreductase [Cellulomonas fimi]|uniref:molybdopterin-dependent oxidoreductase n=1 Tax=Cellulomonas fimi TaxID=1708 RepID=UPI00234DCE75|nr:molybdopterin-dependent oxidoreductase [Cellulomonas fimi]MDC7122043.1 molybdopterin-dependent oxidoreductase [Cellulomonas fimi]
MTVRRSDGAAALAGVAAGVVTLGVGSLVAVLTGPSTDPLVAVGAAFVDATPGWLKDFAASTFGTADKVVLGIGELVVLAGLAALAGVLAHRRWAWGATVVVALGAVVGLAAMGRPDAGVLAPLPAVAGAAAGLLALRALLRRLPDDEPVDARATATRAAPDTTAVAGAPAPGQRSAPDSPFPTVPPPGTQGSGRGSSRRGFLVGVGTATAAGLVAVVVGRALSGTRRGVQAARDALRLPAPARSAAPVPADVQVDVAGVAPWQTPAGEFYRIDTALVVPQVDPATWVLRVHGLVEQEVELTWAELIASDLVEAWVTLACVSNPVGGDLIGNQRWLGLPIREVLARARPTADADMVLSRSVDGFTASTPLEVLTDDRDALLAIAMDGEPLPPEHGFPVRMVVPGLYGYVSATKWVVDLEVTRFDAATAYWTDRGWSERGPVKTQSRIEVPRPSARVDAGDVVVAGTAWAQHRGIVRVQVRVDDGEWQDAELAGDGGVDSWRQWRWTWPAEPGEHQLFVRAFDPDGPQTGAQQGEIPDGATGYDTVRVTVG